MVLYKLWYYSSKQYRGNIRQPIFFFVVAMLGGLASSATNVNPELIVSMVHARIIPSNVDALASTMGLLVTNLNAKKDAIQRM